MYQYDPPSEDHHLVLETRGEVEYISLLIEKSWFILHTAPKFPHSTAEET